MPIIPNTSLEFGKAKQHKAYLHTSWIFCHLRNTAPKWEAGWSVGIVTSQSRKSLGETITYQDHLCRHWNLWIPTYTSESNHCQKCIIGKSHLPWHSSSLTDPKQWKSSLLFDSHKISNVTIWQHQCVSLSPSYFPLMCSQYGRSCHLHLPEEENQKLKHAGWGYSSVLESCNKKTEIQNHALWMPVRSGELARSSAGVPRRGSLRKCHSRETLKSHVPRFAFYCCEKKHWPKTILGKKGVFGLQVTAHCQGSQGRDLEASEQNSKVGGHL